MLIRLALSTGYEPVFRSSSRGDWEDAEPSHSTKEAAAEVKQPKPTVTTQVKAPSQDRDKEKEKLKTSKESKPTPHKSPNPLLFKLPAQQPTGGDWAPPPPPVPEAIAIALGHRPPTQASTSEATEGGSKSKPPPGVAKKAVADASTASAATSAEAHRPNKEDSLTVDHSSAESAPSQGEASGGDEHTEKTVDLRTGFGAWEIVTPAETLPTESNEEASEEQLGTKRPSRTYGYSSIVKVASEHDAPADETEVYDGNDLDELIARRRMRSEDVTLVKSEATDSSGAAAVAAGSDDEDGQVATVVTFKKKRKKVATQ